MSERFNVDTSDVLGANYLVTSITSSNYNPSIDGTVTVTVTVKDVYGDNVSDEEVTVSASGGAFTALNGSSITGASSVTGTTNASGQFTLTYTCSVFGLITFTGNNTTTQIHVTGWKTMQTNSGLRVEQNGELTRMTLSISNYTVSAGGWNTVRTFNSTYNPPQIHWFKTNNGDVTLRVGGGKVEVYNDGSSTTMNLEFVIVY